MADDARNAGAGVATCVDDSAWFHADAAERVSGDAWYERVQAQARHLNLPCGGLEDTVAGWVVRVTGPAEMARRFHDLGETDYDEPAQEIVVTAHDMSHFRRAPWLMPVSIAASVLAGLVVAWHSAAWMSRA
jgi:hypothetical protein